MRIRKTQRYLNKRRIVNDWLTGKMARFFGHTLTVND